MARETKNRGVDLSESSVYGAGSESSEERQRSEEFDREDIAADAARARLEAVTGGVNAAGIPPDEKTMVERFDELDAATDEQVDALRVNLYQEEDRPDASDGSGRVVDEVAEERLAELTETGPELDEAGAMSITPGLDETSARIRQHHPNSHLPRTEAVVEGSVEAPRDEARGDRAVDDTTGE